MQITLPEDTIEVAIHMVEQGSYSPVDMTRYPDMGFIFVDKYTWTVGFALWQQSALAHRNVQRKVRHGRH